jgi:hypothetical protein
MASARARLLIAQRVADRVGDYVGISHELLGAIPDKAS